jgi:hypothetical protein
VADDDRGAPGARAAQVLEDARLGAGVDALSASSSTSSGVSVSSARAIATRCRWPPERVTPRSPTSVS